LQGDIIAIYNASGTKIGSYNYDAWGNFTVTKSSGISLLEYNILYNYNPFHYRGYYYDSDSGFYYLQTRYYNPEIGRFLNADSYVNANEDILGYNMFAYCSNNPVMTSDPTGEFNWDKLTSGASLIAIGVVAIATAATVLSCGAAAPAMVVVASLTIAAGVATVENGIAEVVEAGTGVNVVRDVLMGGNEEAYETYKNVAATAAEIGTMITGSYYAAKGGNVCFVAGTMVATAIGHTGIEKIEAGDWVWATDPETGETALKRVVQTFVNETNELVHLTIGEETISATPTHPFYVPEKGWTSAIELRAGDILVMLNGEYVILEQVQHEILEVPVPVYNFEVEGYHTYYVGDTEVLVHNKCGGKFDENQSALLELAKENKNGVTRSDAKILVDWANEYGISNHGPQVHIGRSGIWGVVEHIKIKNIHIPIIGG